MKISVSFKNIDRSESLKEYVEEKSLALKTFFDGKLTLHWNFSIEHKAKVAHCHLTGNHMDYFGEGSTDDFHASVDEAISKLEKQVRKHKEIVSNHHHKQKPLPSED